MKKKKIIFADTSTLENQIDEMVYSLYCLTPEDIAIVEWEGVKMKKLKTTKPIESTYQTIKEVLEQARAQSYRAVNFAMVQAYWNIGRIIVEEEQKGKTKADYGKQLIAELAKRLKADFGKGFNQLNLWHMRSFYLAFPILDAVRRELTWTHYRLWRKTINSNGSRRVAA